MNESFENWELTFKNKFLIFTFERQQLSLTNKCDNKLVCFNFKESPDYWVTELINTINHNLNLLLNALKWLFCFEQLTIENSIFFKTKIHSNKIFKF